MSRSLVSTLLGHPALYILVQRALGARAMRKAAIEALNPTEGDSVLDIGCGPAYYIDLLPPCDYHGFDTDSRYISYARKRFGQRGQFYDEPYAKSHALALPKFNGVLLMGLLHHLDDAASHSLLDLAAGSLAPGGHVVTLDTVLFDGQSKISRYLAARDRGIYVRSPESFLTLTKPHFKHAESTILGDTWRSPSAYLLMTLGGPVT